MCNRAGSTAMSWTGYHVNRHGKFCEDKLATALSRALHEGIKTMAKQIKDSTAKWVTITDMLSPAQKDLLARRSLAAKALYEAHKALSDSITSGHTAPAGKSFVVKVRGTWCSLGMVDAVAKPNAGSADRPATLADWIAQQDAA